MTFLRQFRHGVERDAQGALDLVKQWTVQAGLSLRPEKTRLIDAATDAFEFLGYRYYKSGCEPMPKRKLKLRDTIRQKTRRGSGVSLNRTFDEINPVLRGWFGYFKHASKGAMKQIDGWVRMRLRSILRNLQNRDEPGRSANHQHRSSAYCARSGLVSLNHAHELARQPTNVAQSPESRMR